MNKPLQKILLGMLCAALFAPLTIQAQNRGYIINGQYTIKGQVDYRKWKTTPSEISFKADGDGSFKNIVPADVIEVGVETTGRTEVYRTINVAIDRSPVNISQLDFKAEPRLDAPKAIFALLLVDGKTQLYAYTDDLKTHYIYRKNFDTAVELINKEYLNQDNSQAMTNSRYKKQLLADFGDCASTNTGSVSAVNYNTSSMTKFFMDYNKCVGDAGPQVFTEEDTKVIFHVLGGAAFTSVKLTRLVTSSNNTDIDMKSSVQPALGFGFTIAPPRSQFNFVTELIYRQYSNTGERTVSDNTLQTTNSYKFDTKAAKLLLAARYNINRVGNKIFILAGATNGYAFSQKLTHTETRLFYNTSQTNTETDTKASKYEFGLLGGVGAEFKKFGVQARYDFTTGFDVFGIYRAKTNTLSAVLTYSF